MPDTELRAASAPDADPVDAIAISFAYSMMPRRKWDDLSPLTRDEFRDRARAAIGMLSIAGFNVVPRKPTDAMFDAGVAAHGGQVPGNGIIDIWQGMVAVGAVRADEELPEEEEDFTDGF